MTTLQRLQILFFCFTLPWLALAGENHTHFKAGPARSGDTHAQIPVRNLHEAWSVKLAEPGVKYLDETLGSSQLVVADGVVYVRWMDRVFAYDAGSGKAVWETPFENSALRGGDISLTYDDGVLYLPGGGGSLMAVKTGNKQLLWTFTGGTGQGWSPIVENGTVYFVGGKTLYCLDAATGGEKWSYSNGEYGILAHVLKVGNTLVYATSPVFDSSAPEGTRLVAVNAEDGSLLWQRGDVSIMQTLAATSKYIISGTRGASHGYLISDGTLAFRNAGVKNIEYNRGGGGIVVCEDAGVYVAMSEGIKSGRGGGFGFADEQEKWFPTFTRAFMPKYGNAGDPWACVPALGETPVGPAVLGVDKYGTLLVNHLLTGNTLLEYHFYRSDQPGISRYGYANFASPVLVDGKIYIAVGDGKLYCLAGDTDIRRAPGGPRWNEQVLNKDVETLFDVSFADAQNGVALTKAKVLRTTDGGKNWSVLSLSGTKNWFHGLSHLSSSTVVGVGQYANILLSNDGGASWQQNPQDKTKHSGRSVFFIDSKTGWSAGHNGFILHTTDAGASWQVQRGSSDKKQPQYSESLQDIAFYDASNGFAVGLDGLMLRSTDGGASWTPVAEDWAVAEANDDLFAVAMLSAEHIFVVGATGRIMRSTDAGESWQVLPSPVSFTLYDIDFLNSKEAYIAGTGGTVLYSNDAGESWHAQNTGTSDALFRLHFVDANTGWAVGSRAASGVIYQTSSGGITTGVRQGSAPGVTAGYTLAPAYPNPFSPAQSDAGLTLEFSLQQGAMVDVRVYNMLGQEVARLAAGFRGAGSHAVRWNGLDARGRAVAPGVYFLRLHAGATQLSRQVLVSR